MVKNINFKLYIVFSVLFFSSAICSETNYYKKNWFSFMAGDRIKVSA